jgi:hypothetical protein
MRPGVLDEDPVGALAAGEQIKPPNVGRPAGKETVAAVAIGVGLGAVVAGPPGALAGGAVGWMYDAIRRRLTA